MAAPGQLHFQGSHIQQCLPPSCLGYLLGQFESHLRLLRQCKATSPLQWWATFWISTSPGCRSLCLQQLLQPWSNCHSQHPRRWAPALSGLLWEHQLPLQELFLVSPEGAQSLSGGPKGAGPKVLCTRREFAPMRKLRLCCCLGALHTATMDSVFTKCLQLQMGSHGTLLRPVFMAGFVFIIPRGQKICTSVAYRHGGHVSRI